MRPLAIRRLGRVEYADGLVLMEAYRRARAEDQVPDTLFLLEHSPVLTLGRKGRRTDILVDASVLASKGVDIVETERGGEVTYHGPGQLVGYPILDLRDRRDVRRYVHDLEEVMIRTAAELGVEAGRLADAIGVWVGPAESANKLGAIGVHLSRWITSHGFALNVSTDLSAYDWIVACGQRDRGQTSLACELRQPLEMRSVEDRLSRVFAEVFEREPVEQPMEHATVQVQVTRPGKAGQELLALRRSVVRGGFWQPITGRLEPTETVAAAAARELFEEIGLRAVPRSLGYRHAFLWAGKSPAVQLEMNEEEVFAAAAPSGFEPRLSEEHDAFEWLSPRDAEARFPFAGLKRGARLTEQP